MASYMFTLGFPVYRDFDGLFFSIEALNLYHNRFFSNNEILVVDNAPDTPEGHDIKKVVERLSVLYNNVRYVPFPQPTGTAVAKQKIFDEANGVYVVVMDSHVLLVPGALDALENYYHDNPNSKDIISGPLLLDDGKQYVTHFIPKWRGQMFGIWGKRELIESDDRPFEIPGCGTGCFAMKKSEWPGFHPLSRGFDCEALYIHEKVRRRGGKAICLPRFKWMHRFGRPGGAPYAVLMWQKVRNYILEFKELEWPLDELKEYFVGGGFLAQADWDLLLSNPEEYITPPKFISFAEDEEKLPQIKSYASGVEGMRDPVLHQMRTMELNKANNILPQQSQQLQPAQNPIRRVDMPPQVVQQPPPQPQNPGGCSSCGKQAQSPFREDVIKRLLQYKNLSEIYLDVQSGVFGTQLEGVRENLEKLSSQAENIFEVGDDPLSTTITLLRNMKQDSLLVSCYFDQKFVPELSLLRELAKAENKKFNFLFVKDSSGITLFRDMDLVVINSPFNDADFIYKLLIATLEKCTHWGVILKTEKYGQITAEKQPGILPGLTRFLVEKRQWSVVKLDKAGLGHTILSVKSEDKPKLPSKIQMAKNFAKALAEHVVSGSENVTPEELKQRLEICSICEHRIEDRCSICGCYLVDGVGGAGKALWKEQHCPLMLW